MYLRALACGVPLATFAPDALAWGLQTHLFFAQWVLVALPFADRELRDARSGCSRAPTACCAPHECLFSAAG